MYYDVLFKSAVSLHVWNNNYLEHDKRVLFCDEWDFCWDFSLLMTPIQTVCKADLSDVIAVIYLLLHSFSYFLGEVRKMATNIYIYIYIYIFFFFSWKKSIIRSYDLTATKTFFSTASAVFLNKLGKISRIFGWKKEFYLELCNNKNMLTNEREIVDKLSEGRYNLVGFMYCNNNYTHTNQLIY